jgi:hypothetical protein
MSALNGKAKAPVKSNQLGMRMLAFKFSNTGNVVSGADKDLVTVTDNTNGNYTITLNGKARSAYGQDIHVSGLVLLTEDHIANVEAVSDSAITIQCRDIGSDSVAPSDSDADFHMTLLIHDWRFTYD